jgi:superfamily II RNA helicase
MQTDPNEREARHWRGFRLSPFQVRAVEALEAGKNVLVGAPTGAGKTLVAEYAIERALQAGKRCVYTSPIKALSNQKYRDFKHSGLDVGLLTGDVTIQPRAQVLIMTTEILRNEIFESPEQLADVEFAVFDEVHFLDDSERGSVWEESLIFAPPQMRLVCLSATVPNIFELGRWLEQIREHEIEVIETHARPVPLHHRVWTGNEVAELKDLPKLAAQARSGFGPRGERGERGRRSRGGPRSERRGASRTEVRSDPARSTERLLDVLERDDALPALVFAFSRKDCERLARRNAQRDLLSAEQRAAMDKLQDELLASFQLPPSTLGGEILSMGRRGIGYHHAGLLPIDKELVERMFTSGLLKLLFTTETFALGINMPARSVVFHSLMKFDGVSVDWLRSREYQQMAGRAGRQGIDNEGLVYSVLDSADLARAPLERIARGAPEPVMSRFLLSYSSLLHLTTRLGRERVYTAWEKSFNQFQSRSGSPKAQERNRRRQRASVDAHLTVLDELHYFETPSSLTARGRIAAGLNGYELQVTELLFRGALEHLSPVALAVVFVALIHQERRRNAPFVPNNLFGNERRHVMDCLSYAARLEAQNEIPTPMKLPDWGLTAAVIAWCQGATMEQLAETTAASLGDVVRALRMAIQLMRQTRHAIDPSWDLRERLSEAANLLNRDEVDARRQLEMG